jgi:hypothetical protein
LQTEEKVSNPKARTSAAMMRQIQHFCPVLQSYSLILVNLHQCMDSRREKGDRKQTQIFLLTLEPLRLATRSGPLWPSKMAHYLAV